MHSMEQDLTQGKPSSVGISRVQELNEVSQDTTVTPANGPCSRLFSCKGPAGLQLPVAKFQEAEHLLRRARAP